MTARNAGHAAAAVERGRSRLLELQETGGFWRSGRTPDVWLTASDLLFREFTGTATADVLSATARWIRSRQLPDGGWADRPGDSAAVSASVLAYCALRLAGDPPDAYHMAVAAGWIRDAGGLAAVGLSTRLWLAIFGQAAWTELPVPPPETVFLPGSCQLRMPSRAGLGGAAEVALSVIVALRPEYRLPFGLAELGVPGAQSTGQAQPPRVTGHGGIDRGLSAYERHAAQFAPLGAARLAALHRCAERIAAEQQPDGSWPAGEPGQHFSLIALRLVSYPAEHPCVARGVASLDAMVARRTSPAGPSRWLEAGGPAIAATAQAVCGLADAGLPADHDALRAAGEWMLASALAAVAGSGPRRSLARCAASDGPGPRVADVAAAVLALRRVSLPASSGQRPATVCLIKWLTDRQRGDGGWGRRVTAGGHPAGASAAASLPGWCAASSALVTARALAALAAAGQPGSRAIRRAGTWLLRQQLPDGSWPGEQGTGEPTATCAALLALLEAGVVAEKAPVARATGWLLQHQNPDGGWGPREHPGGRPAGRGGQSTAVCTAHALLALLSAGGQSAVAAIERGTDWLLGVQLPDGSWPDRRPGRPEGDGAADPGPGSAAATAWALSALAGLEAAGRFGRIGGHLAGADLER